MNLIDIRRIFTQVEDIFHEGGPRAAVPLRRGAIAVTVAVPVLPPAWVEQALQAGLAVARRLQQRGLVQAALLVCQGTMLRLPLLPLLPPLPALPEALPASAAWVQ